MSRNDQSQSNLINSTFNKFSKNHGLFLETVDIFRNSCPPGEKCSPLVEYLYLRILAVTNIKCRTTKPSGFWAKLSFTKLWPFLSFTMSFIMLSYDLLLFIIQHKKGNRFIKKTIHITRANLVQSNFAEIGKKPMKRPREIVLPAHKTFPAHICMWKIINQAWTNYPEIIISKGTSSWGLTLRKVSAEQGYVFVCNWYHLVCTIRRAL